MLFYKDDIIKDLGVHLDHQRTLTITSILVTIPQTVHMISFLATIRIFSINLTIFQFG